MAQTTNDVIIHGKNIEVFAITNNLNGNKYENFHLDFQPSLILTNIKEHPEMRNSKDDEWEVGLVKCSVWNSMPNILASRTNNTLTFTIAGVPYTITLADGNYNYSSINDEINLFLSANGLTSNLLTFFPNTATSRLRAIVKPTVAVNFTLAGNVGMATFLGFVGQNLNNTGGVNNMIVNGLQEPQMNVFGANGILLETIQIRCDIVNHRVYINGHTSSIATQNDILYEFAFNSSPSTLQIERASIEHFVKIRPVNTIDRIRLIITNQDGVELPLNKEATIQLQIRRNMEYRIQKIGTNNNKNISYV